MAFTPGSYTIAYSPTEDGCRVRAGVASARTGIADYLGRLRSSWEHKNLAWLLLNSHEDPSFLVLDPITNTFPATAP